MSGPAASPLHIVPPDRRAKDDMKAPIVGVDAEADVSEAAYCFEH